MLEEAKVLSEASNLLLTKILLSSQTQTRGLSWHSATCLTVSKDKQAWEP